METPLSLLERLRGPAEPVELMRHADTLGNGPEEEVASRLIERLTHLPHGAAMNRPEEIAASAAITVTCPACQKMSDLATLRPWRGRKRLLSRPPP